jgi:tRNA nucleotidyltransferase (CCA-adding enzyme)
MEADYGGRGPNTANENALKAIKSWTTVAEVERVTQAPRRNLLTGDHLIRLGMTPGPAFKHILAQALAAQDDGVFEDEAGAAKWISRELELRRKQT